MKKQILIFTCAITLFSCGEAETEQVNDNNSMVVQVENSDSVNRKDKQINPTKKVFFSHKVSKSISGQDARNLSSDEVEISVYIDDERIDLYKDFGSVDYNEDNTILNVYSDISEKTYVLELVNESQVNVKKIAFLDGEEMLDWSKSYVVDSNNKWKRLKCEGNCK